MKNKTLVKLFLFLVVAIIAVRLMLFNISEYAWERCLNAASPDAAIVRCSRVINAYPDNVGAYNSRGNAYVSKGQIDKGLKDLLQADQLMPGDARILNNLGIAYTRKGDFEKALKVLNRSIRTAPKFAHAYIDRSIAYSSQRQFDLAMDDIERAIALDPHNAKAFNVRGNIYFTQHKNEQALNDVEEALRLMPRNAVAFALRGTIFFMQGDYARSMKDMDEAVSISPDDDNFLFRGIVKFYGLSAASAASDFTAALRQDNKDANSVIWLHIARAHTAQDDHEELEKNSIPLAAEKWPAPIVSFYRGKATEEEVFAAAKKGNAYKLPDQICDAHFYIGEFYLQKNDKDKAKDYLKTAADVCPSDTIEHYAAQVELKAAGLQSP